MSYGGKGIFFFWMDKWQKTPGRRSEHAGKGDHPLSLSELFCSLSELYPALIPKLGHKASQNNLFLPFLPFKSHLSFYGKLTIRIIFFPSVQKNTPFTSVLICNCVKNSKILVFSTSLARLPDFHIGLGSGPHWQKFPEWVWGKVGRY